MKCTNCGREASGKFCSNCGAALGGVPCPNCGHEPPAGARFCNQCGGALGARPAPSAPASVGASATEKAPAAPKKSAPASKKADRESSGGDDNTLWVVGGVVLVGIILVALYPIFSPQSKNLGGPETTSQTPAAGASDVDLTQMTPRQAADRLFNRVMTAVSNRNTQEVTNFLPMAINAYDLARPLNLDGRYHVAVLKLQAGDAEGALAEAEAGLEEYPDHIFLLGSAAQAALSMGDSARAESYYQQLLDAYENEIPDARIEYTEHGSMPDVLRREAEEFLGG